MRWAKPRPGGIPGSWTYEALLFHDLLDDDGCCVGYVREDKRLGHGFTVGLSNREALFPTQSTLEDAKALLIAYLVKERLDQ